ncbi:hypothetical protein SH2C18_23510 [Clostridium sediminicola]
MYLVILTIDKLIDKIISYPDIESRYRKTKLINKYLTIKGETNEREDTKKIIFRIYTNTYIISCQK